MYNLNLLIFLDILLTSDVLCSAIYKNSGVVIGRSVGQSFFSLRVFLTFIPQKLDHLQQHLVNGERPEPARKLGQPRGCLKTALCQL